jgi:ABC-2 type transport system permease protein
MEDDVKMTINERISRAAALLRFAGALFRTSLAAAMAQRGAFLMQVALMALNNAIFFTFWVVLFGRVSRIRGYALADVAVLYGVVAAAFGLAVTVAGGARQLARFIHDGELDSLLAQPKPTLLYALGRRTVASGLGDVASGAVMIGLSGVVHPSTIPIVVLAILASAAVCIATGVLFNSMAFWFGQVDTATRQLYETLIMFSLYPEPLFGGAMRLVLFTIVPAGFVGYLPARLVRTPSMGVLVELVAAALAYSVVAWQVFGRGLRLYSAGSRFELNG